MKSLFLIPLSFMLLSCQSHDSTSKTDDAISFVEFDTGETIKLEKNNKYVVAYVDFEKDCSSCIKTMFSVSKTVESYQDAYFILVTKSDKGIANFQSMFESDDKISIYIDQDRLLQNRLNLSDDAALIVFNREIKLASVYRIFDINAFPSINKHLHVVLQSL